MLCWKPACEYRHSMSWDLSEFKDQGLDSISAHCDGITHKTNSLLVGFLKIYSQGLVAESPALLFGLALCDIHSQNQRTDEDYFIKPLPVSLAINCHEVSRLS